MKKFYNLVLVAFILLSSMVFFACGDKYKKLSMNFCLSDGSAVDSIELIIDDAEPEKATTKMIVKFSGIDEDEVGSISVYSEPSELVNVSNYSYDGKNVKFNLTAIQPTTEAKLVVKHLSSNKTNSIDLVIKQKSSTLQLKNSNYIVSIPDKGSVVNAHLLQTENLVKLLPSGSSDKVYYKLVQGQTIPSNCEPVMFTADDGTEYITGFKTNKNTQVKTIKLYPVTCFEEDDPVEYQNTVINVTFTKVLSNLDVVLPTGGYVLDEDGKYNDETIHLIENGKEKAGVTLTVGNYTGENVNLYNLTTSSTNENLTVSKTGENVRYVQALDYSSKQESVTLSLVPNGYVGDITEISKTVNFEIGSRADKIEIIKSGIAVDADNVDLYDYTSDSALGSLFKFKQKTNAGNEIYEDFRTMQIVVSKKVLNLGVNKIYSDNSFSSVNSDYDADDITNENVLEIYLSTYPLKFYEVGSTFVSEPIYEASDIRIKYSSTDKKGIERLSLTIRSVYTGEFEYLKDVSFERQLSFNHKKGIQAASINASTYTTGVAASGNVENNGWLYLNIDEAIDVDDNLATFGSKLLAINALYGAGGATDIITSATLKISVNKQGVNDLKVKEGYISSKETNIGHSQISEFDYSSSVADKSYIGIVYNSETSIGNYIISIEQPGSNFKFTINCKVYKTITDNDVKNAFRMVENTSAFKNTDFTTEYADADYIVAAGQQIGIELDFSDDVKNSNVITGYDYETSSADHLTENQINNRISLATLNFIKGSYVSDTEYVVTLTIKVKIQEYNYASLGGEKEVNLDGHVDKFPTINFFIYEPISYEDLTINDSKYSSFETRYVHQYLGDLNKQESVSNISVKLTDETKWNYVQSKEQKASYGIGTSGNKKVVYLINSTAGINTNSQADKSISLQFNKVNGQSYYRREITAVIYQFYTPFYLYHTVEVEEPIISEQIIVTSKMRTANNGKHQINMKKGSTESYKLEAYSISGLGDVTHQDYMLQVIGVNIEKINVNNDTKTISLDPAMGTVPTDVKLIVYARDALKTIVPSHLSYANPAGYIIDEGGRQGVDYSNAYIEIDLIISDGSSKTTAFWIETEEDFWAINDIKNDIKDKYYVLKSNVNVANALRNEDFTIDAFTGTLFAEENYYSLYGIKLDNDKANLFTSFAGNVENINFIVEFSYSNFNQTANLGLFDKNNGNLLNCCVDVSGSATFVTGANVNFGALVGENNGVVEYTSTLNGVKGLINLGGEGAVNFGGLVGENSSKVIGKLTVQTMTAVATGSAVFDVSSGSTGLISALTINTSLIGVNSSVGGVVGLNSSTGTLTNMEVGAKINVNGPGVYNIGGVVGKNIQGENSVILATGATGITGIADFALNAQISNIVSHSIITGDATNVGGVTGFDENGVYANIKYQVLAETTTAITGGDNVGGIVGRSQYGKFIYCSVMSYKWDYLGVIENRDIFAGKDTDIVGDNYVGGLVGNLLGDNNSGPFINGEEIKTKGVICNSSVNAYITATETNIGGLLTAESDNVNLVLNAYFIGKLEGTVSYKNDMCLDNNGSSVVNIAYSINYDGVTYKSANIQNGTYTSGALSGVHPGWAFETSLNGGYVYLQTDWQYNTFTYDNVDGKFKNDSVTNYFEKEATNLIYKNSAGAELCTIPNGSSNFEYGGITYHLTETKNEILLKYQKPIFDIAPSKITAVVKDSFTNTESNAKVEKLNDTTLLLFYHKFISKVNGTTTTEIDADKLVELSNTYNKTEYDLNNFISFTFEPDGNRRLKVKSNDPTVIDITSDGKLIINGVGKTKIVFSSVLNSGAKCEINVVVEYPIGSSYEIIDLNQKQPLVNGAMINIPQGKTRLYEIETSGSVTYPAASADKYSYQTNSHINLEVKIEKTALAYYTIWSYNPSDWETKHDSLYLKKADGTFAPNTNSTYDSTKQYYEFNNTISNLLKVSNMANPTDDGTSWVYNIPFTTPFSISVLNYVSTEFDVKVQPYLSFDNGGTPLTEDIGTEKAFKLSTKEGASEISLSYSSAILYPNDITYVTAYIKTDIPLSLADLNTFELIDDYTDNANAIKINFYADYGYDINTKIQTVMYEIVVDKNICKTATSEEVAVDVVVTIKASADVLANVNYRILPQRINSIIINNYVQKGEYVYTAWSGTEPEWNELKSEQKLYTSLDGTNFNLVEDSDTYNHATSYYEVSYEYTSRKLTEVLKQNTDGLIIVNMAPFNGYFDYLEIVDTNSSEPILFTQVDEFGISMPNQDADATMGSGIKLLKTGTSTYIRANVAENYTSQVHTIMVYAFVNGSNEVVVAEKEINVKMLPIINAEYRVPSGEIGEFASSAYEQNSDDSVSMYLAAGTDADFYITTRNSNGEVELELSGTASKDYELVHDYGNFYKLRFKKNTVTSELLNKNLSLVFRTYSYLENGDFDVAEVDFSIDLVEFVVHDISVSSSTRSNNVRQIYGNVNLEVELELYFSPTDISFYDAGDVWNKTYKFDDKIDQVGEGANTPINYINDILRELNLNPEKYISIIGNDGANANKITLNGNKLLVKEDYNKSAQLQIEFELKLENNCFIIEESGDDRLLRKYSLNFIKATSPYEPKLVRNEQEFLSMASGKGTYYILGNDLELTGYTPIDVDITEFDGNGRTITIKSFKTDDFADEALTVGLFKNIKEGMVVKNLIVNYQTIFDASEGDYTFGKAKAGALEFEIESYFDLCENEKVNYNSASFGGLTAINNGVITNCKVVGEVALRASTIEDKKSASGEEYDIEFKIGGLVAENLETGYITNSTSAIKIFSQANIGGFVYENKGKIVSSAVDSVIDYSGIAPKQYNPVYYNYNKELARTIVVELAGFATYNSGEISMSYVNLGSTKLASASKYIGNMSAKDNSAAFVYSNTGSISDAYTILTMLGRNSGQFSGFVFNNTGSIKSSYSYIYGGQYTVRDDYMFAKNGTVNLEDCIEIVQTASGDGYVKNGSNGLKTISVEDCYKASSYKNFTFGNNQSAVWFSSALNTPKLVSTQEKVDYVKNESPSVVGNSTYYFGLKNITVKVEEKFDNGEFKEITTEETDHSSYGTKNNPIILTSLENWNDYLKEVYNNYKYFRIVKDIDFKSVSDNPITSVVDFMGNIQGNNMTLSNIMLFAEEKRDAIGLFRTIVSNGDSNIENAIRNLTLTTTSVWASSTTAVGLLAGVIEDYDIYNITIDSSGAVSKIMVGGNVVGGLAGIIRGEFDIQEIYSNIGVNSTRDITTLYKYNIYMSKNNKKAKSENISSVYYAGSVAGVLDAYTNSSTAEAGERNISSGYYNVKDVFVNGSIVLLADSVGSAFGLVGEFVKVDGVKVNLSDAEISGTQYSGGVVGENRGVLINAEIVIEGNETFKNAQVVSAGAVGFNLNGLVYNVNVTADITKLTNQTTTVGGVVGRNFGGTISNCYFDGVILGSFAGGIIGSEYKVSTLKHVTNGTGALTDECKLNANLLVEGTVTYKNGDTISHLSNNAISIDTLNTMLQNLVNFYSIDEAKTNFSEALNYYKVLGIFIGSTDDTTGYKVTEFGLKKENNTVTKLVFNSSDCEPVGFGYIETDVVGVGTSTKLKWPTSYVINDGSIVNGDYIAYLVGAKFDGYDAWSGNSYSDESVIFTNGDYTSVINLANGTGYKFVSVNSDGTEYVFHISCELDKIESLTASVDFSWILNYLDVNKGYKVNGKDVTSPIELEGFKTDNEQTIEIKGKDPAENVKTFTIKIVLTNP